MKIAMMTNNYKPFVAGVPISVERLAEGLIALGHQVAVFAPSYPGTKSWNIETTGVPVYRYRAIQSTVIHQGSEDVVVGDITDRRIERWLIAFGPDVIHVHHPFLIGSVALSLGKKYDIPVCFTYHTRYEQYVDYFKPYDKLKHLIGEETPFSRPVRRFVQEQAIPFYVRSFTSRCNLVFAPTASMQRYLQEHNISVPICILPTGLTAKDFEPDMEQARKLRNKYVNSDQFLLCTVSRLAKEKNLTFLLQGLAALKEKNGPTFRCLIIGDGPQKMELVALAAELKIQNEIEFVGSIPNEELPAYHAASDLFAFSSQTETQGIVLLEAMAAGKPVVAVRATGTADVIQDSVNGILTNANESDWANAIAKLLNDMPLLQRMGLEAQKTAESFRSNSIAQRAAIYYHSVIDRTSAFI